LIIFCIVILLYILFINDIQAQPSDEQTSLIDPLKPFLPLIIVILVIIIIILVALIIKSYMKQKPKTEKIFYYNKNDKTAQENTTASKTESSKIEKKFRTVEEEIDEFLSKVK